MRCSLIVSVALGAVAPVSAYAQCDEFIGTVISRHLGPVIANADCPVVGGAGLDKKGHKLGSVCYHSTGPTSEITIDLQLNCHGSSESVVGRLVGGRNAPSASTNVTVKAEVRGSDCHLNDVKVQPSGEFAKILAALFDANGKARQALEQGLAEACKK